MNTIPDRIFLQWFGDENDPDPNDDILVSEVSWSLERIFDADIEYKANQPIRFDPAFEEDVQCEAQRPREMIYSLRAQLAEAVELLRRISLFDEEMPGDSLDRAYRRDRTYAETRAFLAKQVKP